MITQLWNCKIYKNPRRYFLEPGTIQKTGGDSVSFPEDTPLLEKKLLKKVRKDKRVQENLGPLFTPFFSCDIFCFC